MLTEYYGVSIINLTLQEVKALIRQNPIANNRQKKEMLREYATLKGIVLTVEDYNVVEL